MHITTSERDRSIVGAAEHWPALDGLRGVAVAAVVAFHLGWASGGFLGVDLFFTLSGFLITDLLIREWRRDGRIDLRDFWARRFRRLLPAVAALLVVVLAVVAVWGTAAEQAAARGDARWALPYLANWHLVAVSRDYWASATTLSAFNHLWSLAIEEQFYLVWPLLAWWVLRRRGERALLTVALLGATASAVAMVVLAAVGPASRVYFGTDTRVVALLLGAAAATAPVRTRVDAWRCRAGRSAARAAVLCIALLATAWLVGGRIVPALVGGGLVVHAVIASLLVLQLAVAPPSPGRWTSRSRPSTWLSRPGLVWLGQRSYGIYLWHWPVIQLIEPRWRGVPAGVRDITESAITLLLAEVSFQVLEQPIRRRVGWAVGGRASMATASGLALALGVAVVAPSGRGQVASFDLADVPPPARPAATSASVTTGAGDDALVDDAGDAPATRPVPSVAELLLAGRRPGDAPAASTTSPPLPQRTIGRVLWVGDSVAADLAPALGAALTAAGLDVVNGTRDGAHLVALDGDDDPHGFYGPMITAAAADAVVVELSYWDAPATLDQLRADVGWFRDTVVATGADLVFVTPPPLRTDLADPGLAQVVAVVTELGAADPTRVHLVDTVGVWGTEMRRDMDGDGAPDRKPDGVHVCPQGAARFAAWSVDALDALFDGITPAFPSAWVGGSWQESERYDTPVGACAALAPGDGG